MTIDFRFSSIKAELQALELHRTLIENQILDFEKHENEQLRSILSAKGINFGTPDADELYQEMKWRTEYLYPKIFRGSFSITLWAAFEASIVEIAKFLGKAKEINPNKEYSKSLDYLQDKFKIVNEETLAQLEGLYAIRNSYAHTNGRLVQGLDETKIKVLKKLIADQKIQEGLDDIIVTKNYLTESLLFIKGIIVDLMEKAINDAPR